MDALAVIPQYTVWKIPKRKGGFRVIESPCDELKKKQKEMLKELQKIFKVSPFAYAFTYYKNISLMATPHVGKKWVACIDLKDFFPSITYQKFFDRVLHPITVEEVVRLDILKTCFHNFNGGTSASDYRLPQGAPTSPLLSNVYLFKFDWLMAWKAHALDCDYTRYADDLVVSGKDKKCIVKLLKMAERILWSEYALKVNHKKTKIVHRARRQMVCGVVVNEKLNTPKQLRKNLRAEIHQLKLKGGEISNETRGRVAFHKMVRENTKTTYSSREIITQILVTKKLTESI